MGGREGWMGGKEGGWMGGRVIGGERVSEERGKC